MYHTVQAVIRTRGDFLSLRRHTRYHGITQYSSSSSIINHYLYQSPIRLCYAHNCSLAVINSVFRLVCSVMCPYIWETLTEMRQTTHSRQLRAVVVPLYKNNSKYSNNNSGSLLHMGYTRTVLVLVLLYTRTSIVPAGCCFLICFLTACHYMSSMCSVRFVYRQLLIITDVPCSSIK